MLIDGYQRECMEREQALKMEELKRYEEVNAPIERRTMLSVADSNLEIAVETNRRVNAIVKFLTGKEQENVDIGKPDSFDALLNTTNEILDRTIDKVTTIIELMGI